MISTPSPARGLGPIVTYNAADWNVVDQGHPRRFAACAPRRTAASRAGHKAMRDRCPAAAETPREGLRLHGCPASRRLGRRHAGASRRPPRPGTRRRRVRASGARSGRHERPDGQRARSAARSTASSRGCGPLPSRVTASTGGIVVLLLDDEIPSHAAVASAVKAVLTRL